MLGPARPPTALFFLQAIVIDDRLYELEKATRSFSNKLIFPGGCLPSLEVIQRCIARETDMARSGWRRSPRSYARTLELWRERFTATADLAARAGLRRALQAAVDALAGMSEAGFRERRLRDTRCCWPRGRAIEAGKISIAARA